MRHEWLLLACIALEQGSEFGTSLCFARAFAKARGHDGAYNRGHPTPTRNSRVLLYMHSLTVPCVTSKVDYELCMAYVPCACGLVQFAVNESVVGPISVGELKNPPPPVAELRKDQARNYNAGSG